MIHRLILALNLAINQNQCLNKEVPYIKIDIAKDNVIEFDSPS